MQRADRHRAKRYSATPQLACRIPTSPGGSSSKPTGQLRRERSCATTLQLNKSGCRYMNMTVWEWFEQRSYHYRDFSGLAQSSDTRAETPSTTLIFPARNVAGTIVSILTVVQGLRARAGLP